ncbi:MAG: hypothetical protein IPJ30_14330 [Acidobacteria bacterium]|nr:hypothetical protein [Acidobacteriota bacterium]
MNLGMATVELKTEGGAYTHYHQFQVQEFRRPGFEVKARVESRHRASSKGNAMFGVEAKYYAGGGLGNAETNWTVTATPTSYTPPNREITPLERGLWWRTFGDYDGGFRPGRRPIGDADVQRGDRRSRKTSFESGL